ncbi:MAG: hypothetical protein DHS80DRAFT_30177 [Piptocephalis tieghemiana]|nr:MAG: hypothetical protein DHS80DRAFT_30177 [Piptocephalis tieghemiana]
MHTSLLTIPLLGLLLFPAPAEPFSWLPIINNGGQGLSFGLMGAGTGFLASAGSTSHRARMEEKETELTLLTARIKAEKKRIALAELERQRLERERKEKEEDALTVNQEDDPLASNSPTPVIEPGLEGNTSIPSLPLDPPAVVEGPSLNMTTMTTTTTTTTIPPSTNSSSLPRKERPGPSWIKSSPDPRPTFDPTLLHLDGQSMPIAAPAS